MAAESAMEKKFIVISAAITLTAKYNHLTGALTVTDQNGLDPRVREMPLTQATEMALRLTEAAAWAVATQTALNTPTP